MRELRTYGSVGALGGKLPRATRIAPSKLGKGGCDIAETFRSNPIGNQSNLTKRGQQSEASLA